jgi:hypothetical protein
LKKQADWRGVGEIIRVGINDLGQRVSDVTEISPPSYLVATRFVETWEALSTIAPVHVYSITMTSK